MQARKNEDGYEEVVLSKRVKGLSKDQLAIIVAFARNSEGEKLPVLSAYAMWKAESEMDRLEALNPSWDFSVQEFVHVPFFGRDAED